MSECKSVLSACIVFRGRCGAMGKRFWFSREFEPHQRLPLLPWARKFTIIA